VKMSTLNRILFFFYMFLMIVMLAVFFAMSVGIWPLQDLAANIDLYRLPWLALLSALMLIISFKYLFLSIIPAKVQSTLLRNTDMGMIRISVNTLDSIAQKAVRSFSEVKDVKTDVIPESDGVRVRVILFILPEVNIPELTFAVQTKVKKQIEDIAGIVAKEVQVYVENVSASQRAKIE